MTSRNGSFASQLDGGSKGVRSVSNNNSSPSPISSQSAFDLGAKGRVAAKAQRAANDFQPSPERGPQPRGMGEQSVNWQAHIKRAEAFRDRLAGSRSGDGKPSQAMLEKAKKAAQKTRAASKSFDKTSSLSR